MKITTYKEIFLGLASAILLSAFIYLDAFGLTNKLLNTFLGLGAFTLLLLIPKRAVLVSGFSVGILWFYWIGYSFAYQGVGYMTPIVTLGFGVLYLLLFLPMYFTQNVFFRAAYIFALSFFEPLDWNWFKPELLFVDSFIGVYKYQFAAVLATIALFLTLKKKNCPYKYLTLFGLLLAINYGYPAQKELPLNMKLVQTDVKQEDKWQRENVMPTLLMVFNEIKQAKQEGYEAVMLPESVIPLFLNKYPKIVKQLQRLSHDIIIITGALLYENGKHYNVTYFFHQGKYEVAKKVVLVPFGEYIPLPSFAKKFVNDTFFGGASDFVTAKKPTDFHIENIKIRNAICYEATTDVIYQGGVDFVVAISNNAWFAPSIEPVLQKLLMRYYARKYGVTIYHAANAAGTGVIK